MIPIEKLSKKDFSKNKEYEKSLCKRLHDYL